ncbi:MAG: hypothetical protein HY565_02910 [Candidatus Kerfeldbacteria bacterium]|nr:hypothetical protein [Candidatus Kerfeldbacteria bacterium]
MVSYVSVVPLIRSIRGKDHFTYATELSLSVGEIVWVPWRNHISIGVVAVLACPAFPRAKAITQTTGTIIPAAYWQWLQWFADFYYISQASALLAALPTWPRRLTTKANPPVQLNATHSVLRLSPPRVQAVQAVVAELSTQTQPTTILYQQSQDCVAIMHGLLQPATGPIVFICPETDDVERWRGWLAKFKPVVVEAKRAATVRTAWALLLHSSPGVLIGTKRLALLPLTQAARICVLDPEHSAHKQWEMNPRYHVWRVASEHSRLGQVPLTCFSQAPRLEQVQTNQIITTLLQPTVMATLTTIVPTAGAYLSPSLVEVIEQHDRVVIWHNRTGLARFAICQHCQYLSADVSIAACPRCQAQSFRLAGFGTAMLKRLLHAQFPERQVMEVTAQLKFDHLTITPGTILIGTNALFARIPWSQVDVAIATSVDSQLAYPGFRSHEETLQQLVRLRNQVPKLYLYTHVPEHPVVQALRQPYAAAWYQATLTERQRYHYPPAADYIKLIEPKSGNERVLHQVADIPTTGTDWMIDREC